MGVTLDLEDYGSTIVVVGREGWGAIPPNDGVPATTVEPPITFIHFTQTETYTCKNNGECKRILQDLQAAHIEGGANDIKFNFMVGGFGTIYEGRGWTKGAFRKGATESSNCLDFAYIGTYNKTCKPEWHMVSSFVDFIKYGVKHKLISPYFTIL